MTYSVLHVVVFSVATLFVEGVVPFLSQFGWRDGTLSQTTRESQTHERRSRVGGEETGDRLYVDIIGVECGRMV